MNTKKKRTILPAVLALLLLSLTACSAGGGSAGDAGNAAGNASAAETPQATAAAEPQAADAGEALVIPLGEISETASFYPVTVDGTAMEVFAVKAPDGTIRTAFNTCQICNGSPLAYFVQVGDKVQCQNCGNLFPMSRVGIESGGCNPVPIFDGDKATTDDSISIPYEVLRANAGRFSENWKK